MIPFCRPGLNSSQSPLSSFVLLLAVAKRLPVTIASKLLVHSSPDFPGPEAFLLNGGVFLTLPFRNRLIIEL